MLMTLTACGKDGGGPTRSVIVLPPLPALPAAVLAGNCPGGLPKVLVCGLGAAARGRDQRLPCPLVGLAPSPRPGRPFRRLLSHLARHPGDLAGRRPAQPRPAPDDLLRVRRGG